MEEFTAHFGGLRIRKLDFVMSQGVKPSVCVCICDYEKVRKFESKLEIRRNGRKHIVFSDCKITKVVASRKRGANETHMRVEIADRRHAWSDSVVGGEYNIRNPAGMIDEDTSKSIEDLFKIVFDAIGEDGANYTLDIPPELDPPYVNWADTPCSEALEQLAKHCSCVVCLSHDDRIYIETRAAGPDTQFESDQKIPSIYNSPNDAEGIEVVFGPTEFTCWIQCDAVAVDEDGKFVELSDAPFITDYDDFRTQWAPECPVADPYGIVEVADAKYHNLRNQVFALYRTFRVSRLYQSESEFSGDKKSYAMTLPDGSKIEDIENILPLSENVNPLIPGEGEIGSDGWTLVDPESLIHFWHSAHGRSQVAVKHVNMLTGATRWDTAFNRSDAFDIDLETGLVRSTGYFLNIDDAGNCIPATVYIYCKFNVKDSDGNYIRAKYRHGDDDKPYRVIKRDDMAVSYVTHNQVSVTTTNYDYIMKEAGPAIAEAYLQESQATVNSNYMEWNGIQKHGLRGRVRQVQWFMSPYSIFTRAGINVSDPVLDGR